MRNALATIIAVLVASAASAAAAQATPAPVISSVPRSAAATNAPAPGASPSATTSPGGVVPLPSPNATASPTAGAAIDLGTAIKLGIAAGDTDAAGNSIAVASRLAAQAAPAPLLAFGTGFDASPQGGLGNPTQFTLFEQFNVTLSSRLARQGQLDSARAAANGAAATVSAARLATAQIVASAFFAVANDQTQLAAARENVDIATRSLDAATARHRVGVGPLIDVERARTLLATYQADLTAALSATTNDTATLEELIGRDVTTVTLNPSTMAIERSAVLRAVERSPAVVAAANTYHAAQASLLITEGDVRPSVTISAGPGVSYQAPFPNSYGPVAAIRYNVPVGTSLSRATIASAQANVAAARAVLTQTRQSYQQLYLSLYSQSQSAASRLPSLQTALANARAVTNATLAAYRLGALNSTALILAQTQLAGARAAVDTATLATAQAEAALKLQTGALTP
jgi:outer membrane protein